MPTSVTIAEDGYELWLRYSPSTSQAISDYADALGHIVCTEDSDTINIAKQELIDGLSGLTGNVPSLTNVPLTSSNILLGTETGNPAIGALGLSHIIDSAGPEGFVLKEISSDAGSGFVIASSTDIGALYGVFAFLRHLQTNQSLAGLEIVESPKIKHRMLNHWDNLTRTVERGTAGFSLWEWFQLPDYVSPRYADYARACASIGINGTVLTNVNANATVLTEQFLPKVAAIADALRPYGVKVYLTARFSAPIGIGGLETADPLDPDVQAWWKAKTDEIYALIPDFGGFLVKANSEGQPGPQNYGRNHADGANMLADAVAPHGGIVIWRAFVYEFEEGVDRHKQAVKEFVPLDGKFRSNVLIQIKNGPIDFMPREPFHPLFGAMPRSTEALELQIAQEYLGSSIHLAFLAPMWKECLDSDTFVNGKGSTVARIIDGSLYESEQSAIAGVANTGTNRNWTGHPLAAANWYAFGRLAWDHTLASRDIAEEWTRMTFNNETEVVAPIVSMLLESREAVVNYMTPLGLHHIMAVGHHYGPGPWVSESGRADWTSTYYHRTDKEGIGFDRTKTGSDAVSQYAPEVAEMFGDINKVPQKYLLWFHHVPWDYQMPSGNTLWDELCLHYQEGVESVRNWIEDWKALEGKIDEERYSHVAALLKRQESDARWWRDACLLYFQTFSERPLPEGVEPPEHDLDYYVNFQLYHVPGYPGEQ